MKKIITISGIECKFKSSAAIPRIYRLKFGRDIFVDMQKMKKEVDAQERIHKEERKKAEAAGLEYDEVSTIPVEMLETFENIAFLMHRHGDPEQPSDIDAWLEQFETFDIYTVLPEILELWGLENKQLSIPKKEARK